MLTVIPQNRIIDTLPGSPIELAITSWLDAKGKRSGSKKTATAYRDTMTDFRAALRGVDLDLDSDPRVVALTSQAWAGSSKVVGREVAPGTFNQRLAIISSFYQHAHRQGLLEGENPIDRVDRRTTQAYKSAAALGAGDVTRKLRDIDKSTLKGQRDYALLTVALMTGRRVSELAGLRQGDIVLNGDQVTAIWRRTKGGKSASDTLSRSASAVLIGYLVEAFGAGFMSREFAAPVWVNLSRRNNGQPIGGQAIADVCQRWLGTSKVHALRHTFAHSMEKAGAAASEIQSRLGHESLATTGRYLAALKRSDNPYADKLAKMMGIVG